MTSGSIASTLNDETLKSLMDSLLNLDDIENLAKQRMEEKAWAYYYDASDDSITKTGNTIAYRSIKLRPRVLIDVTKVDTATKLLGLDVSSPFFISPAAMATLAHPSGELGIAAACATHKVLQIISNNAGKTPEEITEAANPEQYFGWQLYCQIERKDSEDMLKRINKLKDKIKFICLTVDAPAPGKRELDQRLSRAAECQMKSCERAKSGNLDAGPNVAGIGMQLFAGTDPGLSWEKTLSWLKKHTELPIVLKGITTYEDALTATKYAPQVRGVLLSNHGGRALDGGQPAVYTLMEIRQYCPEVFEKLDVWIDGGIKRGTDVVKALCLGAKGVGIGRAPLWGLAAGGTSGVEKTCEILKQEIETCMKLLGVNRIEELGLRHINTRALDPLIYNEHTEGK